MKAMSRVLSNSSWPGVGTRSVWTPSIMTCGGEGDGVGVEVGVAVAVKVKSGPGVGPLYLMFGSRHGAGGMVPAFSASVAVMGVFSRAIMAAGPASAGPASHIINIVAADNATAIDTAILPISSNQIPASRSRLYSVNAWREDQLYSSVNL